MYVYGVCLTTTLNSAIYYPQCVGCHLATYPNMTFFFLKHVPAQGEKENAKGLLQRRSLKKIKLLPQQFCTTAVCECRNSVRVGKHYAQWFLDVDGVKALEVFCGCQERRGSIY